MNRPPDGFAALVLAAGQSRRMGRNKLLLPYGASTVIETIVSTVAAVERVRDVIVITGHQQETVAAALAPYRARCVFNPHYAQADMLASIQTGLRAAPDEVAAALIVLGDQPRLRRAVIEDVLDAYTPDALIIPSYQMQRGHPILLPRSVWPAILALPLDASLRHVIRANESRIRYVLAQDDSVLRDVDTPEDYAALTQG